MAEDAVKVAPHAYKVLFENERVRLLEVKLEPGGRTEMHSHPDTLIYAFSAGKVNLTAPSGEVTELDVPTGETIWMEATEHAADHVGGNAIHALLIEPK